MHRFTDPYTTFYTTPSQSPVHQGFSHYFSITQTTYISRPTTTFVQHSTSPQSFHRYTYALNNPLRYKDPSGEFFVLDSWILGFLHGFFSTGSGRLNAGWNKANANAWNDIKIWGGLFASDPNKNFGGRVWEIFSRFTWQLPQTVGGFVSAHFANTIMGKVNWVKYKYGSTVIQTRGDWGGITQGSYIIGDESIEADPNNPLFQHEYGHYLQSQAVGFAYYSRYGIPSLLSAKYSNKHEYFAVELDANRRAFLYFNKNLKDFYDIDPFDKKGWDFYGNPLITEENSKIRNSLVIDYKNSSDLTYLVKVKPKWYDYASWVPAIFNPFGIFAPIVVGIYNYNQLKK